MNLKSFRLKKNNFLLLCISFQIDASKLMADPGSEGVLGNFFKSLLSKKTGSPGSPGSVQKTGNCHSHYSKAHDTPSMCTKPLRCKCAEAVPGKRQKSTM